MMSPYCAGLKTQGKWPSQEDHFKYNPEKGIFMISDGFGGPVPGAAASRAACDLVETFLTKNSLDEEVTLPFVLRSYLSLTGNVLFNALYYANQKIFDQNQTKNMNERGGASLITGLLDGQFLALAHLGSCSAWLLREDQVSLLVIPKTYGRLTHPFSGTCKSSEAAQVPLAALGLYQDLEPEVLEFRIEPGDWLILQTDGISLEIQRELAENQITYIKHNKLSKEASAEAVFELIRGYQQEIDDNHTILLNLF